MSKKWERVITEVLGVEPIMINSSLVSAQNRKRLYWTNIEGVTVPNDEGIFLGDILESNVPEKYYVSEHLYGSKRVSDNVRGHDEKALCLTATLHKGAQANGCTLVWDSEARGYLLDDLKRLDQRVCGISILSDGIRPYRDDKRKSGSGSIGTIRFEGSKGDTLLTGRPQLVITDRLRRLTPDECARLQTVPYWYKWDCSDTQQYRMLGNGWTVKVIEHILTNLFI